MNKNLFWIIARIPFYLIKYVLDYYTYLNYKFITRPVFKFEGNKYLYFCHRYNTTWKNERAIEIPIVYNILKKVSSDKILEVGNVLSHYFSIKHDVVDKYERAKNVINQDIIDFKTFKKYDLIISISTIEHIGWDDYPKNPQKILMALNHLKYLLNPKGKLILTIPLGYNPNLDDLLKKNQIKFNKCYCFKRITQSNKWIELPWKNIQNINYNSPFESANGLLVGIIINE